MNVNFKQYALQSLSKLAGDLAQIIDKSVSFRLDSHRSNAVAILLLAASFTDSLYAADIKLSVDNITDTSGTLLWSMYGSKETYDSESGPLFAGRSRVVGGTLDVTFHNMPSGSYAIKLFHDANDNGEMDKNIVGLPQEGYGFSNNVGSFGPASFSDAKVDVKQNTQISIRLR
jgi:uncharacterized protein (DUF2141 family)